MARTALTGINDINVFLFTPYPGSELFKELQEEGKIGKLDDAYDSVNTFFGDIDFNEKGGRLQYLTD